jgi:hypothetical protein
MFHNFPFPLFSLSRSSARTQAIMSNSNKRKSYNKHLVMGKWNHIPMPVIVEMTVRNFTIPFFIMDSMLLLSPIPLFQPHPDHELIRRESGG